MHRSLNYINNKLMLGKAILRFGECMKSLPFRPVLQKELVGTFMLFLIMILIPSLTQNSSAFSTSSFAERETPLQLISLQSPGHTPPVLTEDQLAALTIYLEARGESFAGKLAVAAVIRNRMKAKYQSDGTVKGTVLKRLQFQPWNHAKPEEARFRISHSRMRDSLLAWRMVQDGRNVVQGALLFYNPRLVKTPFWATVSHKVASIGGHEFFVPPGRSQV